MVVVQIISYESNSLDLPNVILHSNGSNDLHDVNIYWSRVNVHLNRSDSTHPLNRQTKSLDKSIKLTDNLSLVFKKIQPKHSGLYNCHLNSTTTDFQSSLTAPFEAYTYFIHVSDNKNEKMNGTYTEWNYYKDYVYRSGENKMQAIPHHANQTSKPSLIVHWSAWGNCNCGKYKFDTRSYRYAYCCVKLFDGLILPCQSVILKEIHQDVARIVENIFTFKEYRRCMDDCIPGCISISFYCRNHHHLFQSDLLFSIQKPFPKTRLISNFKKLIICDSRHIENFNASRRCIFDSISVT